MPKPFRTDSLTASLADLMLLMPLVGNPSSDARVRLVEAMKLHERLARGESVDLEIDPAVILTPVRGVDVPGNEVSVATISLDAASSRVTVRWAVERRPKSR